MSTRMGPRLANKPRPGGISDSAAMIRAFGRALRGQPRFRTGTRRPEAPATGLAEDA